MLFCSLIINLRWSLYPLYIVVFAAGGDYFFETKYSIAIASVVVSVRPTDCQEFPQPPHDFWSQDPEPSVTHAYVCVVMFSTVTLKGMTNPKTALESTATVAAASIWLTGGREFPHPPHNVRSQELGSLIAPAPLYIVLFFTVAL